jgi:hypothetical protein
MSTEKLSDAQRFERHVANNLRSDREVFERRQRLLAERPEVEMGKTNGNVRRDQSGT